MTLERTDPPLFLYDPVSLVMFITDDMGTAVPIPGAMWYAPHLFPVLLAGDGSENHHA